MEPVDAIYHEMDELLHDYFARTIASEGVPELRMNWTVYMQLNNAGNLLCFTARDENDELLGFVMYHIYPHLHHMGMLCAACDIVAVHVDERGNGVGAQLMEYAEPLLRNRGVQLVTHQFRTCYKVEPLFIKQGYKLFEQTYMKEIR